MTFGQTHANLIVSLLATLTGGKAADTGVSDANAEGETFDIGVIFEDRPVPATQETVIKNHDDLLEEMGVPQVVTGEETIEALVDFVVQQSPTAAPKQDALPKGAFEGVVQNIPVPVSPLAPETKPPLMRKMAVESHGEGIQSEKFSKTLAPTPAVPLPVVEADKRESQTRSDRATPKVALDQNSPASFPYIIESKIQPKSEQTLIKPLGTATSSESVLPQQSISDLGPSMRDALETLKEGKRVEPSVPRQIPSERVIVAQISERLTSISDKTIEIQLSPKELGQVKFAMTMTDTGQMVVAVDAEREDITNLLRRHADELIRDFQRLGFEKIDLSFSKQSDKEASQNAKPTSQTQVDLSIEEDTPIHSTISVGVDIRL